MGTSGNPAAVKGTGKNGSMNVKLEDEDIDYLRELSERDYVARIAQNTLAPNIQVTFTGDISRKWTMRRLARQWLRSCRMRLIQHRRDCIDEL